MIALQLGALEAQVVLGSRSNVALEAQVCVGGRLEDVAPDDALGLVLGLAHGQACAEIELCDLPAGDEVAIDAGEAAFGTVVARPFVLHALLCLLVDVAEVDEEAEVAALAVDAVSLALEELLAALQGVVVGRPCVCGLLQLLNDEARFGTSHVPLLDGGALCRLGCSLGRPLEAGAAGLGGLDASSSVAEVAERDHLEEKEEEGEDGSSARLCDL